MEFNIISVIVAIFALGLAIYATARSQEGLSVKALIDSTTDIEAVAGAAQQWVLAAEQLWQTGRVAKDKRFYWVLDKLRDIYPEMDDKTLAGSIEAAVQWMKLMRGRSMLESHDNPNGIE